MDFRSLKVRLARRRGFDGNPDRLGQFINDAIQEICGVRAQWSWLLRHHQFETKPPLSSDDSLPADVGTVTSGGHRVENVTLAETNYTITGSLVSLPDGNCYRIAAFHADAGGKLSIFLEQPYRGASSASAEWKIYYDEYPLPHGASSLASVVATGNGWTYPVSQESQRQQAVHSMVTRDAEASPLTYSVMMHSQLPEIPDAMWKERLKSDPHLPLYKPYSLPPPTGVTFPREGVYYYWAANLAWHTLEVGPLSGPILVENTAGPLLPMELLNLPAMSDYGLRLFRSVRAGDIGSKESKTVPPPRFLMDLDPVPAAVPAYRAPMADWVRDSALGHHMAVVGGTLDQSRTSGIYHGRHHGNHGSHRVRFWPPVDEHYLVDIQYFTQHPELLSDNDAMLIPVQYASIVLDFAEALALGEEENFSAAQTKRANGAQKLDAAIAAEDVDPGTTLVVGGGESPGGGRRLGGRWPKHVS